MENLQQRKTFEEIKNHGVRDLRSKFTTRKQGTQIYLAAFPKDLLSRTYSLLHVRDAATSCCTLVNPSVPPKGCRSSNTQDSGMNLKFKRIGIVGLLWLKFSLMIKKDTSSMKELLFIVQGLKKGRM